MAAPAARDSITEKHVIDECEGIINMLDRVKKLKITPADSEHKVPVKELNNKKGNPLGNMADEEDSVPNDLTEALAKWPKVTAADLEYKDPRRKRMSRNEWMQWQKTMAAKDKEEIERKKAIVKRKKAIDDTEFERMVAAVEAEIAASRAEMAAMKASRVELELKSRINGLELWNMVLKWGPGDGLPQSLLDEVEELKNEDEAWVAKYGPKGE